MKIMRLNQPIRAIVLGISSLSCAHAELLYHDTFDGDTLIKNKGAGGGAVNTSMEKIAWKDNGNAILFNKDSSSKQRALFYTANNFQSDTGFKLTVVYMTHSAPFLNDNQLSLGLVSADTNLANHTGSNPFTTPTNIYSFGVTITDKPKDKTQGVCFANGSTLKLLKQTEALTTQPAGKPREVTLEMGAAGYWCYRIDGQYHSSGVMLEDFDLSKKYQVVVYGENDNGGGKLIESIKLENRYAPGERAAGLKGKWTAGVPAISQLKKLKTLDSMIVRFSDGASLSAKHFVPHKLLERVALGQVGAEKDSIASIVPSWGDLSAASPETDAFLEEILEIKSHGFSVKAYTNSENFVGSNQDHLQPFVDRWKQFCDTDPKIQAFIKSQPFHTGVWNGSAYKVALNEDGTEKYPNRKYMFCYAEFILKDYALRYGEHFSSWVFDDGSSMEENGDNATSGKIEEQRIYQAFANAIHAGNPDTPLAFNNGRSRGKYASFPFAPSVRFEDFTFGHAFGGNNDHASKTGGQFKNNYNYVKRMINTKGHVHAEGKWKWDDLIVGNFHSKISTTAWKYGPKQAWEQDDFNQWNLEALTAGAHMTWAGSYRRKVSPRDPALYPYALDLYVALDEHLAKKQYPNNPNWARAHTVLPPAITGKPYHHILEIGKDLWDPEDDAIASIVASNGSPDWLKITKSSENPAQWILSGSPTASTNKTVSFTLIAKDTHGNEGSRKVHLNVKKP